jgi:hypothetical protein
MSAPDGAFFAASYFAADAALWCPSAIYAELCFKNGRNLIGCIVVDDPDSMLYMIVCS